MSVRERHTVDHPHTRHEWFEACLISLASVGSGIARLSRIWVPPTPSRGAYEPVSEVLPPQALLWHRDEAAS